MAESTVDRLVDYCLHTPEDKLTTCESVRTLNNLINRNLALMNNCGQYNNKEEKVLLNV